MCLFSVFSVGFSGPGGRNAGESTFQNRSLMEGLRKVIQKQGVQNIHSAYRQCQHLYTTNAKKREDSAFKT